MLLRVCRRNLILLEVNNEGTGVPPTRRHRKAILLRFLSTCQLVIKPNLRGNLNVWWSQVTRSLSPELIFPPLESPRGPNGESSRVPEAQRSVGVSTPCQKFPGGSEGTKVVVAEDDRDDGFVLELRDDHRERPRSGLDVPLEHYRGRVGEERGVMCRDLNVARP